MILTATAVLLEIWRSRTVAEAATKDVAGQAVRKAGAVVEKTGADMQKQT